MLLIVLEAIFAGDVSFGTWAVYLSMTGTMLLMKYRALGKKHELVFGLLQLSLAAVFLVVTALRLVK